MPKRVIDDEALWTSSKLGRVKPVRFRPEYANLLPLALGNGVFEANPQSIWARVYACNRPDILPKHVEAILAEYERVKLLFRWQEPDGRQWGYWVGIEKPGRLPAPSRIQRKEQFCGPIPPQDKLIKFLGSASAQYVRNTCIGSGSGSGEELLARPSRCSESEVPSNHQNAPPAESKPPSEVGFQMARLLKARILQNNPEAKISEAQVLRWAKQADLMMRCDGRAETRIRAVIEWSQRDPFWLTVILSMENLRKKFDQLTTKMRANDGRPKGQGVGAADPRRQESEKSKMIYAALEEQPTKLVL